MDFDLDNSLGILVANVRNSIRSDAELRLQQFSITPAQCLILLRLYEKENITQKELAHDTYFKQPSLTLMIDKLEKKELVKREASLSDRRAHVVTLTKKGKSLKEELTKIAHQAEKRFFEGFDESQRVETLLSLKKIYKNLNR